MRPMTAGGHTFKQQQVDGPLLRSMLARMSEKDHPLRIFLRKAKGCVITEIPMDDLGSVCSEVGDEDYVLIIEERAI